MPYLLCAITMIAVAIVAAMIRGDRVMRLGVIGAATTALPWALACGLVACMEDRATATRLLRLGTGTIALVGPNLLLVLLGVSGQLERYRWVARLAGVVGAAFMAVCWATDLIVPGVHPLASGTFYISAGPLTGLHSAQLVLWLMIGMFIVRRTATRGERRIVRLVLAILVLAAMGSIDVLLVYQVWGGYPIAWLPALVGGLIALYLVLFTDLLRPQGFDRDAMTELFGFLASAAIIAVLAIVMQGATVVAEVVFGSLAYVVTLGVTWVMTRQRPVRVAGEHALEEFVAGLADVDDERKVAERVAALWKPISIAVRATWRTEVDTLVEVTTGARWALDREVAAWLVHHVQAVAPGDLSTMRLGPLRAKLEAMVIAHGATLLVPLIDRGVLVGIVEADHGDALREDERRLVHESARAVARALTYAALARAAATEGATAREVEVAEAMRLQASASRDDELGRWTVAAEYRTAPRTTGANWSTSLLADGRVAVLVTEAQAHGVAAALATATLTGAFAAATVGVAPVVLDDLLANLRASADGVMRGGEAIAAFIAILDADRHLVTWACAGHPGANVIGPVAYDVLFPMGSAAGPRPTQVTLGGGGALGDSLITATRGETPLPPDALLVIASTALRGADPGRWESSLRELAPAGPRLAAVLVEAALRNGAPHEDFLAVVVRQRPDRRGER